MTVDITKVQSGDKILVEMIVDSVAEGDIFASCPPPSVYQTHRYSGRIPMTAIKGHTAVPIEPETWATYGGQSRAGYILAIVGKMAWMFYENEPVCSRYQSVPVGSLTRARKP